MVGLDSNRERTGMAIAGERKKLKDLIREGNVGFLQLQILSSNKYHLHLPWIFYLPGKSFIYQASICCVKW